MKTVLISGANGFIGGYIAKAMKNPGVKIIGIDVEPKPLKHFDEVYRGRLLEPLKDVFDKEKIDVFIHCAYHMGKDEYKTNVTGTILWAKQAQKNNAPLQIFVSSISAREDSLSVYGRLKYDTEKWFVQNDQVVIRLGLVIGNGGFFQRMVSMVRKWPMLPLLNQGKSLVYFIGIEDVCKAIRDLAMRRDSVQRGIIWNFFQPNPVVLRMVLQEIKKQYRFFCIFIPVPYGLVLNSVLLLERIPFLKLKMNSNNIRGLRQNDNLDFESDFSRFGYKEFSIEDLVKKAYKLNSGTNPGSLDQ
jgi:nucleoside-diphosphate-sugar epimerase